SLAPARVRAFPASSASIVALPRAATTVESRRPCNRVNVAMSSSKKIETEEIRAIAAGRSGGQKSPAGGESGALGGFFASKPEKAGRPHGRPKTVRSAGRGYLPCGVL